MIYQVQPIDAIADNNIRILHQNMLFPLQSKTESDEQKSVLMKANLLMDVHFNS